MKLSETFASSSSIFVELGRSTLVWADHDRELPPSLFLSHLFHHTLILPNVLLFALGQALLLSVPSPLDVWLAHLDCLLNVSMRPIIII